LIPIYASKGYRVESVQPFPAPHLTTRSSSFVNMQKGLETGALFVNPKRNDTDTDKILAVLDLQNE
jgi:hypothetical protein